jgi:hypothetical protein
MKILVGVVIAALGTMMLVAPAQADPNGESPSLHTDILGNAGAGGYDGIPITPGDGIGPGGALPEGFLALPGPYTDTIGPGVYSPLEDPH